MRTVVIALALTGAMSAQAAEFDVCQGLFKTAAYAQKQRQAGVTDEAMQKEVNEQWMPAAVRAKMTEYQWKIVAAGAAFAYKQPGTDTPYEVGREARNQCWKMVM